MSDTEPDVRDIEDLLLSRIRDRKNLCDEVKAELALLRKLQREDKESLRKVRGR